jgi:hypothetical protein
MVRENIVNLFKRNKAATSIIEALKKDPQRVDQHQWERMYDRIYSEVTPRERRWMHKEVTIIKSMHRIIQIAVLELGGEGEDPNVPSVAQTNASNMHHGAGQQAYSQHLMNQQMNASALTPSQAHNIYGNIVQRIIG